MKSGPIIIVEDDADDEMIFEDIIRELNYSNQIIWFENCDDALHYLLTTRDKPFIIICDINMPRQNGLEFKMKIDHDPFLRNRSIPFIFYSTTADQETVNQAYTQMTVQGFFQKQNSFPATAENLEVILKYWSLCRHPNS